MENMYSNNEVFEIFLEQAFFFNAKLLRTFSIRIWSMNLQIDQ